MHLKDSYHPLPFSLSECCHDRKVKGGLGLRDHQFSTSMKKIKECLAIIRHDGQTLDGHIETLKMNYPLKTPLNLKYSLLQNFETK